MSNYRQGPVPARLAGAKGTSLAREVFTSNFWMSRLAILKYIPRSFRVKQVDGMAFFTDASTTSFGRGFSELLLSTRASAKR